MRVGGGGEQEGDRQAFYNRAIVLGPFSGETSLYGASSPRVSAFPCCLVPPERQAQDRLGKDQNELCSYLQEMPEDPPSSRNAPTPARGGPTPTSLKETLYLLVTTELPIPTQYRPGAQRERYL